MSLVSSIWREVTQKLSLSKAIIGFCTIVGEKIKEKPNLRMRSASRLSLANDSNFDRNPLRGCNYGLEGGAFLILGGCSSLPKEEERLHEIMC